MRSAERISLPVGRSVNTGTPAADSFWATDCMHVNATDVSLRRQSRSWNKDMTAGLPGSSRTCTASAGRPSSAKASSTSARLRMSTLARAGSLPVSRLALSSAA